MMELSAHQGPERVKFGDWAGQRRAIRLDLLEEVQKVAAWL